MQMFGRLIIQVYKNLRYKMLKYLPSITPPGEEQWWNWNIWIVWLIKGTFLQILAHLWIASNYFWVSQEDNAQYQHSEDVAYCNNCSQVRIDSSVSMKFLLHLQ